MSRELQHKHTMDQFKEVCNGTNCRASKAMPYHSEECRAEHDALHENRRASPTSVPEGYVLVPVEIIDRFQELNPSNYDHDDVCALNAWAVELVLSAAPAPPVSEDRKDAERYHKLANYMIGTRFDIDDALVAASSIDEISSILDAMQEDKP